MVLNNFFHQKSIHIMKSQATTIIIFLSFTFFVACNQQELTEISQESLSHTRLIEHTNSNSSARQAPYVNPNNNPCDIDEEDIRILFIGGIHTADYTVDIPQMLEDLALHNGQDIDVIDESIAFGFLGAHLTNPVTLAKIDQGNWDYVILEETQNAIDYAGSHYSFSQTVTDLRTRINNSSPNVKILLYQPVPHYDHANSNFHLTYTQWNTIFNNIANAHSNVYVVNVFKSLYDAYNNAYGYVDGPLLLRTDPFWLYLYLQNSGGFLATVTFYASIFRGKPCIPTDMYFYQGNGNSAYGTVNTHVNSPDILAQIGYRAQYSVHPQPSIKCISYPVGVYPCP